MEFGKCLKIEEPNKSTVLLKNENKNPKNGKGGKKSAGKEV